MALWPYGRTPIMLTLYPYDPITGHSKGAKMGWYVPTFFGLIHHDAPYVLYGLNILTLTYSLLLSQVRQQLHVHGFVHRVRRSRVGQSIANIV